MRIHFKSDVFAAVVVVYAKTHYFHVPLPDFILQGLGTNPSILGLSAYPTQSERAHRAIQKFGFYQANIETRSRQSKTPKFTKKYIDVRSMCGKPYISYSK